MVAVIIFFVLSFFFFRKSDELEPHVCFIFRLDFDGWAVKMGETSIEFCLSVSLPSSPQEPLSFLPAFIRIHVVYSTHSHSYIRSWRSHLHHFLVWFRLRFPLISINSIIRHHSMVAPPYEHAGMVNPVLLFLLLHGMTS